MTDERLKELYSNLLNDVDFDKLDPLATSACALWDSWVIFG
ncbi:hypothetical protein OAF35_06785 [Verrucomicrobiales bacterium]|nr:hypothetical protein [Verrucomicrobiales bacterium]